MDITKLILYWENFEAVAERQKTVRPEIVGIAEKLETELGGSCQINTVGPFPEREDLKPCLKGQTLAWICEDIENISEEKTRALVEDLKKNYPYIELSAALYDWEGRPLELNGMTT